MFRIRVLYIGDPGSEGGAARSLVGIVKHVKQMGAEPIVVTSVHDGLNEKLEDLGIQTIACGHRAVMSPKSPYLWKRPLKYPYEAIRYYKSLNPAISRIEDSLDISLVDVIHTNSSRNDIGCILQMKYGIPHVMHIREFGQEDFACNVYRWRYYRFLNAHCSVFLAVSSAVAESWVSKGICREKMQVLYNGVDVDAIQAKERYSAAGQSLSMLIAGGICEPKGQHLAIEAVGLLPTDIRSNVRLDIIGWADPNYVSRLKRMISKYHIESQVRLLGPRSDLNAVLKNYDIGLMCSKSEGFGRVTAEYMCAGLFTIGANAGATPELISQNETGLLFDSGDSLGLARQIEACYRSRNMIAEGGRKARGRAEACFSSNENAKKVMGVYESLLPKSC